MLKNFSRTLSAGLLGFSLVVSQQAMPGTFASAQTDAPTPPQPPIIFAADATPEAPAFGAPEPVGAPPIPPEPTPELAPEQLVREMLAKGRAILYPGHVLTPTETPDDSILSGPNEAEDHIPTTKITGTVIVSDTGLPMSYVRVVAYNSAYAVNSDFTDRQGKFEVNIYSPGQYAIRIDPSQVYPYDLAGEWYDDQTLSNTATLISTTVGSPSLFIALNRGSQITGSIVASDTGAPLAGMTLAVYDANGTFLHSVLTDEAGRYTTGGLRSSSYRLCAFAYQEAGAVIQKSYPGGCYDNQDTPALATPLTVTEPNALPNITLNVPRSAQITGVVTAIDTGAPLAGVEVDAIGRGNGNFGYTFTNSNGQYVLDGLRPGVYSLYFSTRNGGASVRKYVGEYYNKKRTLGTADVFTLTASAIFSNVNAVLDLGGRITGVVTAEDTGVPLSETTVYLLTSGGIGINTTRTNARGEYTFSDLSPSPYKLYFSPLSSPSDTTRQYFGQYYANQFSLVAANPVTPTLNQTTGNINVRLDRGGQITGVVAAKDTGAGLNGVSVTVYRSRVGAEYFEDAFGASTLTDAQGHYTVTAPGGLHTVYFHPYFSLAPYCGQYYNQRITRADVVSVVPKQVTANVNGLLDRTSHIGGIVTSAEDGAPLNRVFVQLLSVNDNNYFRYGMAFDVTDAQGRYDLGPLCAGQYGLSFDPTSGLTQTGLHAVSFYNHKPTFETRDVLNLTSGVSLTLNTALTRKAIITGTVRAADTGEPSPNAYVNVFDLNGKPMLHSGGSSYLYTSVNADGNYILSLPPGSYKLNASSAYFDGYASEFYSATASFDDAITVVVAAKQVMNNINFALQRGGIITGQVTNEETGAPIPFALVNLYDASNPNYVILTTQANERGIYTTRNYLRTGNYKARVSYEGYLSRYHGDSLDFGSASVISVTSSITTTNANVRLLSIRSPKLSTRLHMPLAMRSAGSTVSIAATPIVLPPLPPVPRSTTTPVVTSSTAMPPPTAVPVAAGGVP